MTASLDRSAPGVRIGLCADETAGSVTPLDLSGRIIAFTFEDTESKADRVSITLDNFNLSIFESEALAGGSVLEVSWGYPGCMAPPRRVVVKKLKGFSTLTVEAQAVSSLMNRVEKTRAFENMTRSTVAKRIAAEHGYARPFSDIEDTEEVFDTVNQTAETDAQLLRRMATREGFEFFVDGSGLHFHSKRQDAAPSHVLTWYADPGRGDVMSVHVESDLTRRTGKVTVKGRDPKAKTTIKAEATSATVKRTTLSEVVEVVDPETGTTTLQARNATETVHASPASTAKRASREADARFRRAEGSAVKLSLQVVGDPTLAAKSVVEMRGISSLLSGKYYVREVKHAISSSGYTCEVKATRDGVGRRARPKAKEQGGASNTTQPSSDSGDLKEVEVVDPETGKTRIEYRATGQRPGAGAPEARTGRTAP